MLLGDAHWWSGEPNEAVHAYERAYDGFVRAKEASEAATVGSLLAYLAMRRMAMSVAAGWVARVEDLLHDEPESAGHAWLGILRIAKALFFEEDLAAAERMAEETIDVAKRQGAIGPQALAISFKGIAMTFQGRWQEGTRLVDEASVLAMSRGDDLRATSDVYCNVMGVCSSLADYRRAGEWTEQAERWMRTNGIDGFTGICQVHRAELERLRGHWSQAEQDARSACLELERFRLLNGLGFAHYEIGEVRRRRGDLDAADEAFATAYEYGHSAQPGRALLLMDQGDVDGALRSIRDAVAATSTDPEGGDLLTRGQLLPGLVEIAVAAGDLDVARDGIAELDKVAATYDTPTWEARVLTCTGSVRLAEGHAEQAIPALDRAWRLWQAEDLPYETALTREMLGRARQAAGDEGAARLEFRAARSVYDRLGARRDLDRLAETLGEAGRAMGGGERTTKAFMFTDIVTSTDLVELIGDDAWQRLLDWHDRELRTAIARHDGVVVRHTGDGFFVTFDSARDAVDAAVDVQRRLVDHRLEHGFSPTVRIGAHLAEATSQHGDYVGMGVHVAARIGALGGGEEIVVSDALANAAGPLPYRTTGLREVSLKGVRDPVSVMNVDWRR